jgi:excisionase family DNA binding protein
MYPMTIEFDNLLTVRDVLRRLNISRTTLWRLVKNGEIGIVQVGKQIRFKHEQVEAFIRKNTVPAKK